MRYLVKHEIKGRIRVHFLMKKMSFEEADTLEYYLINFDEITKVKVYERTADAAIFFDCDQDRIREILSNFTFENVTVPKPVLESSSREATAMYFDKIVTSVMAHYTMRLVLPFSVRGIIATLKSIKYIWRGLKSIKRYVPSWCWGNSGGLDL